MWFYYFMAWIAFGLAFWFDTYRYYGWPKRWRARHSCENGWRELILIDLPISIVGGPLWWVAFLVMKLSGRA